MEVGLAERERSETFDSGRSLARRGNGRRPPPPTRRPRGRSIARALANDRTKKQQQRFLQTWNQRKPVVMLPVAPPDTARLAMLQTLWQTPGQTEESSLTQRGAAFAEMQPTSPLTPEVFLLAAPGLEAAALAAESTLIG